MRGPKSKDQRDGPHPIDVRVGMNVRLRRKSLNISQGELAASLGLSFQQVQKYESGANRISASKLHDIAEMLETPVAWFFEEIDGGVARQAVADETIHTFLTSAEGAEVVSLFPQVRPATRRQLLQLIRMLVSKPAAEP